MRCVLIIFLFVFSTTIGQDIENLNKRELRELANSQKKQIIIKNSQINDQKSVIENSSERIKELNQTKIELEISLSKYEDNLKDLEKNNISLIETIKKLNAKNSVIPELENEIVKLKDSINSINNLLFSYKSEDSLSIYQKSSADYGFLNNLYLGFSQIENQTFRLVPAGIIAINELNSDNSYYDENGYRISQFLSMSELKIGIQEKKKTFLTNKNDVKNYKKFIKDNNKIISGPNLYNLYPKLFPTFSFLKGKLLSITNDDESKDFLFSIKEKNTDEDLENQLGQKGKYFSLTDDNEKEYLLELILINNEVYLTFNFRKNSYGNEIEKLGVKWEITSNHETKLIRYYGDDYTQTANLESAESRLMDSDYNNNTRKYTYFPYENSDYYIECDRNYMSIWLVPTIYEKQVRITPGMFLFKLEEI